MRGLDSLSKQLSLDNREPGLMGREDINTGGGQYVGEIQTKWGISSIN